MAWRRRSPIKKTDKVQDSAGVKDECVVKVKFDLKRSRF